MNYTLVKIVVRHINLYKNEAELDQISGLPCQNIVRKNTF